MAQPDRRLVPIVSLDVVGFSRLVEINERQTMRIVQRVYDRMVARTIGRQGGKVFKTMGDGLLAEFQSVVAAIEWVAAVQTRTERAQAEGAGRRALPGPRRRRAGRRAGRRRRPLRCGRQPRGPRSGDVATGRHVHHQVDVSVSRRAFGSGVHRSRADRAQEHFARRCASMCGIRTGWRSARRQGPPRCAADAAVEPAVGGGAAVRQSVGRSGPGLFRRCGGRGNYLDAVADPGFLRDRPQFGVLLQGPLGRCAAGRT